MTGYQHMMVVTDHQADLEYDDITLRFRTLESNGLLLAMRDDHSNERKRDGLEVALSRGGILINICMSGSESVVRAGADLDRNIWHTLQLIRSALNTPDLYCLTVLLSYCLSRLLCLLSLLSSCFCCLQPLISVSATI